MFMCQWMPSPACPSLGSPPPVLISMRMHARRVLLIVAVMSEGLELRPPEFLRPVALLAGLLRRAKVLHRRGDGPGIGAQGGVVNLAHARELGLHVPAGARSDVAFDASHTRVRRGLIGGELRVHDGMAQLAAEIHRIGELVGLVAADGAHQREDHHEAEHKGDGAALRRVVEVEPGEMRRRTYSAQPPPPLDHHPDGDQDESQNQESRRHHVGENADVGRGLAGKQVNENQQNDVGEGDAGQRQADQADGISNEILRNWRMIA